MKINLFYYVITLQNLKELHPKIGWDVETEDVTQT